MATRSTIVVKVKPEDIDSVRRFSLDLLPKGVEYSGSENVCMLGSVKLKEYISIYHHWDGYPSGLGVTLQNNYNDYNTMLNIMLGGSASNIDKKSIIQYCASRNEDWKATHPRITSQCPKCDEEYIYLLEDDVWKVCSSRTYPNWQLLSECLENEKK